MLKQEAAAAPKLVRSSSMACASGVRYEVKAQRPVMVKPSSKIESAPCFLSSFDQAFAIAGMVLEPIFVFNAKNAATRPPSDGGAALHPAKPLKEALGDVLVHFYPLAGRLRISPDADGKLFIECNGQGVVFVEAEASVNIAELGSFLQPDAATLGPLVSPLPAMDDPPLLSLQVTRFTCGGVVLGVVFQHCLFDAVAIMEFLSAWGEIARGVAPPLSTPPVLDRSFLQSRSPLQISYPHMEYLNIKDAAAANSAEPQSLHVDLITRSFCFTSASLETLRKKAMEDGVISKCTAFEALAALLWRARTTALWSEYPEQRVKILIAVDGRSHLQPPLPKGYVGNALAFACALATAKELQESPLSHVVKRLQNTITSARTDEYIRSQLDYIERHKLGVPPLEASISITSWCKLPFNNIDFGWGKPKYVGPPFLQFFAKELIFFLPYGHDAKDINMVLALPPKAMRTFEEILHPHLMNPLFLSPKL